MAKSERKRLYAAGTLILYGRIGVCRVEDIIERKLPGEKGLTPFYFLRPLYQGGTISAPVKKVEDGTIFSRTLMNREQAQTFIKLLPTLPAQPYLNQLKEHYRQQIQSLTALDMARLIRSIYKKRQDRKARSESSVSWTNGSWTRQRGFFMENWQRRWILAGKKFAAILPNL